MPVVVIAWVGVKLGINSIVTINRHEAWSNFTICINVWCSSPFHLILPINPTFDENYGGGVYVLLWVREGPFPVTLAHFVNDTTVSK